MPLTLPADATLRDWVTTCDAPRGPALSSINLVSMGLPPSFATRWSAWRATERRPHLPGLAVRVLRDIGEVYPDMRVRDACEWVFAVQDPILFDVPGKIWRWSEIDRDGGWVYAAAGFTVIEAMDLRDAGSLPSRAGAAVMAGLRL